MYLQKPIETAIENGNRLFWTWETKGKQEVLQYTLRAVTGLKKDKNAQSRKLYTIGKKDKAVAVHQELLRRRCPVDQSSFFQMIDRNQRV